MVRLAIALLSLAASVIGDCPASLDGVMELPNSGAQLYYAIVPSDPSDANNGISLCARLEADGESWVGFGISENGGMVGSVAIIGSPEKGTVLKYDLNGKDTSLVVAMPDDKQTLMDAYISQQGGRTVMEFTKLLIEDGEIPILEEGENNFLFAKGSGNELGYHANRVAFIKDFSSEGNQGVEIVDGDTTTEDSVDEDETTIESGDEDTTTLDSLDDSSDAETTTLDSSDEVAPEEGPQDNNEVVLAGSQDEVTETDVEAADEGEETTTTESADEGEAIVESVDDAETTTVESGDDEESSTVESEDGKETLNSVDGSMETNAAHIRLSTASRVVMGALLLIVPILMW